MIEWKSKITHEKNKKFLESFKLGTEAAKKYSGLKMKKAAILIILIFLNCIFLFSQEWKGKGRLLGQVFDEQGNPLAEVKVKLFYVRSQSGFEVMTETDGKWKASWIRNGMWYIDFEKAGFLTKKISVDALEPPGKNPEITVSLKKAEGPLLTEELKAALIEGNKLFDEGKYEEAIQAYQRIIEKFPETHIINKNIGNAYFQMEKYDRAEEYYQKVFAKDPQNVEIMVSIGNCYANRGEAEKSLEWYNRVEFEKIIDPVVLYNIGANFYKLSRFDEALKYYRRAVELKGDFLDGLYQLGLVYLALGNYQETIDTFENYLKNDADSGRATQVKGFIEFLKKK